VRRDSTFVTFDALRAGVFDTRLDPFRDAEGDARFADFAFKCTDLEAADARPAAFLVGFVLDFAFVAMAAATYTGYVS
jgi:hypothetical protein